MLLIGDFLRIQAAALRRIAGATRGDMSIDDVRQEAWLVASDIEQRRGYPVDFGDAQDQDLVIRWLYGKLVKFAEKQMRHAVRLDRDWQNEDAEGAASALARLLTAPLDSDPLVRLQQLEHEDAYLSMIRLSYSEAAAYVILLVRFDWEVDELASDLRVTVATLRKRLRTCGVKAKVQPSLFDGVSVVDSRFEQLRSRWRTHGRLVSHAIRAMRQRFWKF